MISEIDGRVYPNATIDDCAAAINRLIVRIEGLEKEIKKQKTSEPEPRAPAPIQWALYNEDAGSVKKGDGKQTNNGHSV